LVDQICFAAVVNLWNHSDVNKNYCYYVATSVGYELGNGP